MDSTYFTFKEKWQMVPIKRWNGKLIKQNKRIIKEYVTWKNLTLTLEVLYIYIYIYINIKWDYSFLFLKKKGWCVKQKV